MYPCVYVIWQLCQRGCVQEQRGAERKMVIYLEGDGIRERDEALCALERFESDSQEGCKLDQIGLQQQKGIYMREKSDRMR
eukprot:c40814_g1_i1 orf=125-367(-)